MLGTDDGVYFSDLREPNRDPIKMLALAEVTQVDVLEDYQLLIVLSGLLLFHKRDAHNSPTPCRTSRYYVPPGRIGRARPDGRSEAGEAGLIAYIVLQSWRLSRSDASLCRESECIVDND